MIGLRDRVLREFGDAGAETLARYVVQVEYTAFWCIRMLRSSEDIQEVVPEGVEDVLIVRPSRRELHQVKTRDEGRGPWTTADVLPILCQQYQRRLAFPGADCCFHFVSNRMADHRGASRGRPFGSLYRLKALLEIEHDGQKLTAAEAQELQAFEDTLIPEIQGQVDGDTDPVDVALARTLIHKTWIDTDSDLLRSPRCIEELDQALAETAPGEPHTVRALNEFHDRLVLMILRKIIRGRNLDDRKITPEDVLSCRTECGADIPWYPDLGRVPGLTPLEKKAHLGGFDSTELRGFQKQAKLAEWHIRKLRALGLSERLERLTAALIDEHSVCRHELCRLGGSNERPGPDILARIRKALDGLARQYFPDSTDIDKQFCLGLLWRETNLCNVWWHGLDGSAAGGSSGH
jgi:hypothetical protein